MKLPRIKVDIDWVLVIIPIVIAITSCATLYSITAFSGKGHLVIDQIINFGIGIAAYLLFAFLDYRELRKYYPYLYILGLIFLALVIFLGDVVYGSRRWINLGFVQFQPSEIMKLFYIICAASFLSIRKKFKISELIVFSILALVPMGLILAEPDLGTALTIIIIFLAYIFLSGVVSRKYALVVVAAIIVISPVAWSKLLPYQKQRLSSFLNSSSDPLGSGYNVNQSKIAIGSGGLTGRGFSGATQSQLQFLPIAHIDFIFSGWAEATGFLGSVFLVGVYAVLIWRVFSIYRLVRDDIGGHLLLGVGILFAFQTFVNIGMNTGILPVTGIPLPLMSYGGTSILTSMALLGMVQSVYLRRKSLKFE